MDPLHLALFGFGALIVTVPVALLVRVVRSSRRKVGQVASAWESFARARGYELQRGGGTNAFGASAPTLTGMVDGVPFEATFSLGSSTSGHTSGPFTQVTRLAEPFPKPLGMRVTRRGIGAIGLGKRHPTGDGQFDAEYGVHATDPVAAELVGPACRECLMLLAGAGRELSMDLSNGVGQGWAEDRCELHLHGQAVTDHGTLELAIRALTALGTPTSPG